MSVAKLLYRSELTGTRVSTERELRRQREADRCRGVVLLALHPDVVLLVRALFVFRLTRLFARGGPGLLRLHAAPQPRFDPAPHPVPVREPSTDQDQFRFDVGAADALPGRDLGEVKDISDALQDPRAAVGRPEEGFRPEQVERSALLGVGGGRGGGGGGITVERGQLALPQQAGDDGMERAARVNCSERRQGDRDRRDVVRMRRRGERAGLGAIGVVMSLRRVVAAVDAFCICWLCEGRERLGMDRGRGRGVNVEVEEERQVDGRASRAVDERRRVYRAVVSCTRALGAAGERGRDAKTQPAHSPERLLDPVEISCSLDEVHLVQQDDVGCGYLSGIS